jgi:glycosyltransferase involved in cell wall biosynthesis
MRILVVHNRYLHSGGEDSVVDSEMKLLADHGHDVELYTRDNADIETMNRAALAIGTVWSRSSARMIEDRIAAFRPDILHAHNTFPLISPAAYWVAHSLAVPVVQTLHNFRLICPQAMLLRDGKVCEACVGRVPWPAVRYGCYQGSRTRTAAVASMVALHRGIGTWRGRVSRYVALNDFCRQKFIEGGLPADRIVVKPNFVAAPPCGSQRSRSGFLFVGRLSPEKGVAVLADATARTPGAALRVAGTGPAGQLLAGVSGVDMLGAVPAERVMDEMAAALALVLPSIWYENFPRTLVEAFASGLPVIASRLGAMAELIEDGRTGLLFEPGSADDLAQRLRWASAHPGRMAEMGRQARAVYDAHYTASANIRRLIEIYQDARADAIRSTARQPAR